MSAATLTEADRMKALIRAIGRPPTGGEHVAFQIKRASRRLTDYLTKNNRRGLSERTARDYWYGYRPIIPTHHMEAAEALLQAPAVKAARNEFKELEDEIRKLESASVADPDFYSPHLTGLRAMARLAALIAPWAAEGEGE